MSKSKGNFFTIRDLLAKGWSGPEIRYALLSAHYRSALNFTEDSLVQARASIKRIQEAHRIFARHAGLDSGSSHEGVSGFQKALFDDLNVSDALAVVFEAVNQGLKKRESDQLSAAEAAGLKQFLEIDFNNIYDVLELELESIPEEITTLLQQREKAREDKDWGASDSIRDQIRDLGWEVLDEAGGQSVKKL